MKCATLTQDITLGEWGLLIAITMMFFYRGLIETICDLVAILSSLG